jgi:hypothetical protein
MPQGLISVPASRRFVFERDTFAFANELACEYQFDPARGRPRMVPKTPRPAYVLRCFVLARAVRQFLFHAEFQPKEMPLSAEAYRLRIRTVVARNPRVPCPPARRVRFPGYAGLRAFSQEWERVLKEECGGAWRSYVLRSHWRMVFPIRRAHQQRTRDALVARLARGIPPIVHLVRFPQLTINHGMTVFAVHPGGEVTHFEAYDPNDPARPASLVFDERACAFMLEANRYWPGGPLDVLEIYRSWWF